MVYEKKRSGDPDYDDKQPPAQHGMVKEAPDGTKYRVFENQGPTTLDGQHFNLADHDLSDLAGDNRPAPGEVATEPSTVQSYDPASAPSVEVDFEKDNVEDETVPMVPNETPAATPTPPPAKKTAAKK